MKKLLVFLGIFAAFFSFADLVKASDPEYYEIDPFRVLVTFDKSVADLSKEVGRKKALEIIKSHGEWNNIAFINEQNLAIVGVGKLPKSYDILDSDTLMAQFEKSKAAINDFNSKNYGVAQFNFNYTLQGKIEKTGFMPSDQLYVAQTNLFAKYTMNGESIGFMADEGWNLTERKVYEGRGVFKDRYTNDVVVAIIDDGLGETSYDDQDIKNILWGKEKSDVPCLDFNGQKISCPNGSIDMPKYLAGSDSYGNKIKYGYHGEVMAKIIAAQIENSGYGMAGINNVVSSKEKYVRIIPINTKSEIRTGDYSNTSWITSADLVAAIHFAKRNRADIINLSMIKSSRNGEDNALLEAIKFVGKSGIFTVAIDDFVCQHHQETVDYIEGSFAPIICTTGYTLPTNWPTNDKNYKIIKGKGIFNMTFTLKNGETMDLVNKLFWNSGNGHLAAPGWAIVQQSSTKTTYKTEGPSVSNAHIAGALAHIFRFGIAQRDNKALARCILENASDEYLFWNGVERVANLGKIAKFSGNLSECRQIENEKRKIPAPKLEVKRIKLLKAYKDAFLNDVYDLGFDVAIPKDYAYDLEYLINIKPYMGYRFGIISIANVQNDGDDNIFQIKITYAPKSDKSGNRPQAFIDQRFCASILARGKGSLNSEWSDALCVYGSEMLKQSENLTISAEIDQNHLAEVFNKKNEDFDIVKIVLSGVGSISNNTYDIEASVTRKFECDVEHDIFKPAELRLVKNSFLPPIIKKFSKIKLEDGRWVGEVKVPRYILTPLSVSIIAKPTGDKAQAFERILYPTDGYFCIIGAQYNRNSQILEVAAAALIARESITKQPVKGMIDLWVRSGKLENYFGYDANINLLRTESRNQIWTVHEFEISDINPLLPASFYFDFKMSLDELKRLGGLVFFDVNANTKLTYFNEEGKALALPAYFGIPEIKGEGGEGGRDSFYSVRGIKIPAINKITASKEENISAPTSKKQLGNDSEISIVSASSSLSGSIFKAATKSIKKNSAASQWFEISNNSEQGSNAKVSALFSSDKNFFFWSDAIYLPQNSPYCITAGIKDKFGKIFRSAPYCFGGMSAIDNTR